MWTRDALPSVSDRGTRRAALGGILGALGFVAAWITSAAITDNPYSSIDDAISRLAAVETDTRWLMTAGFVIFGVSLPIFSLALRSTVGGLAPFTAATTGVATLAVAASPLDHSATIDSLHGLFATVGYVTLAATPVLAASPLASSGHRRLAHFGVAAGVTSAVALALTPTTLPTGLFQRIGLTVSDAWIVATAIAIRHGRVATRRSGH